MAPENAVAEASPLVLPQSPSRGRTPEEGRVHDRRIATADAVVPRRVPARRRRASRRRTLAGEALRRDRGDCLDRHPSSEMSTPTVNAAPPSRSIPPLRSVQWPHLAPFFVRLLPAFLALVFGAIIVGGRPLLAAAPLAGLAVFFLSRSPVLPYLTVVIVIATFAEPYAFPQFNFAGINPFLSEVIFGLALTAGL